MGHEKGRCPIFAFKILLWQTTVGRMAITHRSNKKSCLPPKKTRLEKLQKKIQEEKRGRRRGLKTRRETKHVEGGGEEEEVRGQERTWVLLEADIN